MKKHRYLLISFLALVLSSCAIVPSNRSSSPEETTAASEEETSSIEVISTSEECSFTSEESSSTPVEESSSLTSEEEVDPGYYRAEKVNESVDYPSLYRRMGTPVLGTKGKKKLLVIPVEFADYPFSEDALETIRAGVEGTPEETGYWESLKSYYEESSYGELKLEFEYSDVLTLGTVEETYAAYSPNNSTEFASYILREGVASYKKAHGNSSTKEFDGDNDGYIDSTIIIYSAPTYYSDGNLRKYGGLFWAFTTFDYVNNAPLPPRTSSPVGFRFFWSSYFFFEVGYVGYGRAVEPGVDAHTLIHEAGHLMGCPDYYSYDGGEDAASPSGGKLMMDHNLLDHDIFTKLSFGWVNPYVVTDDCEITIGAVELNGDCILLANDWNGTAFDEFILLEFFTGQNLNYKDSHDFYPEYAGYDIESTGYSRPGIRAWHIDNRLFYGAGYNGYGGLLDAGVLTKEEVENFSSVRKYVDYGGITYEATIAPGISNSSSSDANSVYGKGFEQIQFIQKGGKITTTAWEPFTSDDDLFHEGDFLDATTHYGCFPNMSKAGNAFVLNSGEELPYSIYIESIDGIDEATISISKIA